MLSHCVPWDIYLVLLFGGRESTDPNKWPFAKQPKKYLPLSFLSLECLDGNLDLYVLVLLYNTANKKKSTAATFMLVFLLKYIMIPFFEEYIQFDYIGRPKRNIFGS